MKAALNDIQTIMENGLWSEIIRCIEEERYILKSIQPIK